MVDVVGGGVRAVYVVLSSSLLMLLLLRFCCYWCGGFRVILGAASVGIVVVGSIAVVPAMFFCVVYAIRQFAATAST